MNKVCLGYTTTIPMAEELLQRTPPTLRRDIEAGEYHEGLSALLAGLAAFAGWTLSRLTKPPRVRWVNLLGAVGILALVFSVVSPYDDAFQQELIRPGTLALKVSPHTRVAPRRPPADLSITALVEAGSLIRVPKTGRSFVMDQPLELDTHFHAPIPIHSPPAAS